MSTKRPERHNHREGEGEGGGEGRHHDEADDCPMRPGKVDTVALDIRPLHDYEKSGVGHLSKVNCASRMKRAFSCNACKSPVFVRTTTYSVVFLFFFQYNSSTEVVKYTRFCFARALSFKSSSLCSK